MTTDVSCKSCQRSLVKPSPAAAAVPKSPSLAELRKTAKTAKTVSAPAAPAPAVAPAQPVRSAGFSVKAAWAARLTEQGDRCRLPRGKAAKQRHV